MDAHEHLVFHLGSSPKFVRHAFERALAAARGAQMVATAESVPADDEVRVRVRSMHDINMKASLATEL